MPSPTSIDCSASVDDEPMQPQESPQSTPSRRTFTILPLRNRLATEDAITYERNSGLLAKHWTMDMHDNPFQEQADDDDDVSSVSDDSLGRLQQMEWEPTDAPPPLEIHLPVLGLRRADDKPPLSSPPPLLRTPRKQQQQHAVLHHPTRATSQGDLQPFPSPRHVRRATDSVAYVSIASPTVTSHDTPSSYSTLLGDRPRRREPRIAPNSSVSVGSIVGQSSRNTGDSDSLSLARQYQQARQRMDVLVAHRPSPVQRELSYALHKVAEPLRKWVRSSEPLPELQKNTNGCLA